MNVRNPRSHCRRIDLVSYLSVPTTTNLNNNNAVHGVDMRWDSSYEEEYRAITMRLGHIALWDTSKVTNNLTSRCGCMDVKLIIII